MEPMADAYVQWQLSVSEGGLATEYELPEGSVVEETRSIVVVDMFCALCFPFYSPVLQFYSLP